MAGGGPGTVKSRGSGGTTREAGRCGHGTGRVSWTVSTDEVHSWRRRQPGTHFGQCRGESTQQQGKKEGPEAASITVGGERVASLRFRDRLGRVDTNHESGCWRVGLKASTGQDFCGPFFGGEFSDR
jgi:hypothetical protein